MKLNYLIFIGFLFFQSLAGQTDLRKKYLVYTSGKPDFIESYLHMCCFADSTTDREAFRKEMDQLCSGAGKAIEGYR